MTCPKCGSDTKVYDSRYKWDTVARKRECLKCGTRFQTREVPLEVYEEIMQRKFSDIAQEGASHELRSKG